MQIISMSQEKVIIILNTYQFHESYCITNLMLFNFNSYTIIFMNI